MSRWKDFESAPKDRWIFARRPMSPLGTWDRICIVRWCDNAEDFVWPTVAFDIYEDDLYAVDDEGYRKTDTYEDGGSFTEWMDIPE